MSAFLLQYLPIVIFFGIAGALGVAFMLAAAVVAPKAPDPENWGGIQDDSAYQTADDYPSVVDRSHTYPSSIEAVLTRRDGSRCRLTV